MPKQTKPPLRQVFLRVASITEHKDAKELALESGPTHDDYDSRADPPDHGPSISSRDYSIVFIEPHKFMPDWVKPGDVLEVTLKPVSNKRLKKVAKKINKERAKRDKKACCC